MTRTAESPSLSAGARMHPLTLRFDASLERDFQREYFDSTLSVVRLANVLGAALYSVFGVLDAIIVPDAPTQLKTYLPDFVVMGTGR